MPFPPALSGPLVGSVQFRHVRHARGHPFLHGLLLVLRIPEFRSLELVMDDVCKVIMPPFVRSLDVERTTTNFGGVPGILYVPAGVRPIAVIVYLHGGG